MFQKGKSGNPGGRPADKPFRDALRIELAAAGKKSRSLRHVARALIVEAATGNVSAIREIADRLDGKPPQDTTITVQKRDATDWTRDELVAILGDAADGGKGVVAEDGRDGEPDIVH